jgi:hypothetical protein
MTTTTAQSFPQASASLTLNATAWITGSAISATALNIAALSPIADDILLTVSAVVPSGTLSDLSTIQVWASPSEDGTHFPDNDLFSATNAYQASMPAAPNIYGPFKIYCRTGITQYGIIDSLITQFNFGLMPRALVIILENRTGLTLTSPAVTWSYADFTNG